MKLRILMAAAVVTALVCAQGLVADDKAESKYQAKCPVSGQPAKEASTVEFKGGNVQFCCDNCPKAFEANPDKFAAKAVAQMLGTGEMKQVACPFSGRAINPEATVAVEGVTVGFCCNNCKGKAEKADDKLALLFGGDLSKGYTAQTKCPISGKPIDVEKTVDYEGAKVYFCCGGCPEKFKENPAQYAAKLPQLKKAK